MNWEDAEMKLKGKPDGSFLVRDSSDPRYILSLSFRSQGITHHTRMEHYRGEWSIGRIRVISHLVRKGRICLGSLNELLWNVIFKPGSLNASIVSDGYILFE